MSEFKIHTQRKVTIERSFFVRFFSSRKYSYSGLKNLIPRIVPCVGRFDRREFVLYRCIRGISRVNSVGIYHGFPMESVRAQGNVIGNTLDRVVMILWQWKVSLNSLNLNLTSLSDKRKIFFPVVTICNNLELKPNDTIWKCHFCAICNNALPQRDFSEFWTLWRVVCECLYVSNALIICNSLFVECAIVIFDGFNFVKQIPDISN